MDKDTARQIAMWEGGWALVRYYAKVHIPYLLFLGFVWYMWGSKAMAACIAIFIVAKYLGLVGLVMLGVAVLVSRFLL